MVMTGYNGGWGNEVTAMDGEGRRLGCLDFLLSRIILKFRNALVLRGIKHNLKNKKGISVILIDFRRPL